MKKKDLRNFDIVRYRDRTYRLYALGQLMGTAGHNSMDLYNADLTSKALPNLTSIDEVHRPILNSMGELSLKEQEFSGDYELIWKRDEEPKISIKIGDKEIEVPEELIQLIRDQYCE